MLTSQIRCWTDVIACCKPKGHSSPSSLPGTLPWCSSTPKLIWCCYLPVYLGAWKLPPAQRNRSRQLTVGWEETGVSLPFCCQWILRSPWPILITHTKKARVSFSASPWLLYFNLCPLSLVLAPGTTEDLHLPIRYLLTLVGSSLLITRCVLPASSCTLFLPTWSTSVSFYS